MRKRLLPILLIFLVSSILRFYKFGQVPAGLSLAEVNFGQKLTILGTWVLNPILIRIPFAILGIVSVLLLYQFVKKISGDRNLALVSGLTLSIIPWHIEESRVFSWEIIFLTLSLFVGVYSTDWIKLHYKNFLKYIILICVLIFCFSVVKNAGQAGARVDVERTEISMISRGLPVRFLSNKFIEGFRVAEKKLFENLDFGTYFFAGHPRERWGMPESNKIYLFMLPLIVFGISKIDKRLGIILAVWTFLAFFTSSILLLAPAVILISIGIVKISQNKQFSSKVFVLLLAGLGIYEFLNVNYLYFGGFSESIFSPRRPAFAEVTRLVSGLRKNGEQVLVSEKLGTPEVFFKFYLKNKTFDYEFRDFDIRRETDRNKLFVDAISDEPKRTEPLFADGGKFPPNIDALATFEDRGMRQKIVVYRVKLK